MDNWLVIIGKVISTGIILSIIGTIANWYNSLSSVEDSKDFNEVNDTKDTFLCENNSLEKQKCDTKSQKEFSPLVKKIFFAYFICFVIGVIILGVIAFLEN